MNGRAKSVWYALGLLPAVWLGLLVAPAASGGLFGIIWQFPAAMQHPLHIIWCEDSGKAVLFFAAAYGLLVGVVLSTRRNYRRGVEHGSAKWGSPERLNRKYCAKPPEPNKVFTQHIRMGLDGRKHRRNLNTVVVGGSGAGKTRCYAKPCLYEACLSPKGPSFVCLDPKGELLRDSGGLLRESGYDVRVLDLLHMEKSHCYNPFVYLTNDNEVQMLVTNLFKATTPKGAQSQDPFWDSTASILLSALVYYLYHEAPPEEQNFPMVMEMLRAGEVREDDDSYLSALDVLFERLEMRDPAHIAVKYYKQYRSGSAKTLKSIQITLASHMEKFNLDSLIALTATDELHLQDMGEKRVALFALIPDSDTSFNFLVSILYQQLFQQLFDSADHKHGGSLPVPVHFLMDEFANISLPNDFEIKLSTMRSRNVFVSIILQNIAQLKALFEKQWESVLGNCDELLYLGGNEQGSHKYISELLGKATIDTNTYGKSSGRNGNYSTNYQITGRDGTYTIVNMPNADMHITINKMAKALDPDAVDVVKYLELDNKTMYMVTVWGELSHTNLGSTNTTYIAYTYDDNLMYDTSYYTAPNGTKGASSWLVIVDKGEEFTKEEALKHLKLVDSTEEQNKSLSLVYFGIDSNVNGSKGGQLDINDVQLVYDMYNSLYENFEQVSVKKFLLADQTLDRQLNSADAVKLADKLGY